MHGPDSVCMWCPVDGSQIPHEFHPFCCSSLTVSWRADGLLLPADQGKTQLGDEWPVAKVQLQLRSTKALVDRRAAKRGRKGDLLGQRLCQRSVLPAVAVATSERIGCGGRNFKLSTQTQAFSTIAAGGQKRTARTCLHALVHRSRRTLCLSALIRPRPSLSWPAASDFSLGSRTLLAPEISQSSSLPRPHCLLSYYPFLSPSCLVIVPSQHHTSPSRGLERTLRPIIPRPAPPVSIIHASTATAHQPQSPMPLI
jgi:hypothetical protein